MNRPPDHPAPVIGQVDFYVRSDSNPEALEGFACRLVESIWRRGHRVLILTPSDTVAQRLDDRLWTFRDVSFVPHRRFGAGAEPASEPVIISTPGLWNDQLDVLLNLMPTVPAEAARASRIVEIVPTDGDGRDAGRQRFRTYRERGFRLETHHG